MVLLLGVDGPEGGLVDVAGGDAVDDGHGGEHGVVLVVVLVHAVAADEEEVGEAVGPGAEFVEAGVGAEVGRVGLGDADDVGVEDFGCVRRMPIFCELAGGEGGDVGVGHGPERVGVVAEVFEADPDLGGVGDHVRATSC